MEAHVPVISPRIISVIIRTYNEARYLDELLVAIRIQEVAGFEVEIVLVDSGSQDGTLEIADRHHVNVVSIKKSDFTFGRSLNVGCRAARGAVFVLISGHCVPVGKDWLAALVQPIFEGIAVCTYGRQIGRDTSKFSEVQLFSKYFPPYSKIHQDGFFCNNANAAVSRESWERFGYNEDLTGLEDMYLARQLYEHGGNISYVSSAAVYHIHSESWRQVKVRYEREALALQQILPNVHFNLLDFFFYTYTAVVEDIRAAIAQRCIWREAKNIFIFRLMQYWGTYKGARRHRIVSESMKRSYFYPKDLEKEKYVEKDSRGVVAHEGQQ